MKQMQYPQQKMNIPITFILLIISSCTSLVFCAKEDESTLLKIKEQWGNPEFLSSWVHGFDYCNDSSAFYVRIECTSTGRVKNFVMGYVEPNAIDSFPQAICDLTELEGLYAGVVHSLGPLPSCINNLTNLRDISIWRSGLKGPLPKLDNLKKLTRLSLQENDLSGPIPPSLSKLPNLYYLNLGHNSFSGSIPSGLIHGPGAELRLNDNYLTGEIPRCYDWVDFNFIDLSGNNLTGDASFLFGKHKTVTSINLSFNQFHFDLSNVEIPENLTFLDLSFNRLYGKVPDLVGSAPKLTFAYLVFNGLCGIEPDPDWRLRHIYDLIPHNNTWKGTYDLEGCLCGSPELPPCNNQEPAPAPMLAP